MEDSPVGKIYTFAIRQSTKKLTAEFIIEPRPWALTASLLLHNVTTSLGQSMPTGHSLPLLLKPGVFINRPGVAGAVLQTPPLLIN